MFYYDIDEGSLFTGELTSIFALLNLNVLHKNDNTYMKPTALTDSESLFLIFALGRQNTHSCLFTLVREQLSSLWVS